MKKKLLTLAMAGVLGVTTFGVSTSIFANQPNRKFSNAHTNGNLIKMRTMFDENGNPLDREAAKAMIDELIANGTLTAISDLEEGVMPHVKFISTFDEDGNPLDGEFFANRAIIIKYVDEDGNPLDREAIRAMIDELIADGIIADFPDLGEGVMPHVKFTAAFDEDGNPLGEEFFTNRSIIRNMVDENGNPLDREAIKAMIDELIANGTLTPITREFSDSEEGPRMKFRGMMGENTERVSLISVNGVTHTTIN